MPNRTSAAYKAISLAWSKEQQLVREGKGTRDWTPEQQQDILDRGKAYGDDGKAFEGHHMKSAEKYPEYQGDLENIQFLSRTEHFAAHDGNFQTPTNGYYNPTTGETSDFGLDKYEPCEILELSEPIIISMSNPVQNTTDNADTLIPENVGDTKAIIPSHSVSASKNGFLGKVKQLAIETVGKTVKWGVRNKDIIVPTLVLAATAFGFAVKESLDRNSNSTNQNNMDIDDSSAYDSDGTDVDDDSAYYSDPDSTSKIITERSSPREHIVNDPGQHYHTKEGVVWKDKKPYLRGKNSDE